MLHLHDLNKKKIAGLVNYKDLQIEKNLGTGDCTLSFSYSQNAKYYDEIREEGYIRTKENEFVIKEKTTGTNWDTFKCVLNVEDLEGKVFDRFESKEQTIENALNLAIVGTGWTVGHNDITKKRTVKKTNCSSWEIIQDIKKTYSVDIEFDSINKKVNVYEHLGQDKGTYFIESLNVKALEVQSNSHEFYTRIIPTGKDGLTIKDINCGKDYLENHQYSNKIKTFYWKDDRYTIVENLKEDAAAKLKELSKPYRAYKADVIDLAKINDTYKNILDYSLGDTITLISKDKKIKEKQRIVKIIEYPENPELNNCEIANTTFKFEDLQKEFQETTETVSNITSDNGTVRGSTIDGIKVKQIEDFEVNVAKITGLEAVNAEIQNLHADKADIQSLNAVTAKIGRIEATVVHVTDLDAVNAHIKNLEATTANIRDLEAATAKISVLESHAASIDHVLAGNITADNIATGSITAGSGIIANEAIGDAQISSISANKLSAGSIDTSKIQILGAKGRLRIIGDKLQVLDDADGKLFERIMLGVDDNNKSTLILRDENGKTTLIDQNGITDAGFTSGYGKVKDNSLDVVKFDKNSIVRQVNNATETIKGTKVQIGDRTLDVELSTQKNTITEHNKELGTQKATIQALDNKINLKVDNQTFTEKTEVINKKIDNIEIGGRNYILNSNFSNDKNHWGSLNGVITFLEKKCGYVITKEVAERYIMCQRCINEQLAGKTVTLSFLIAKTSNVTSSEVFILSRKKGSIKDWDYASNKQLSVSNSWTKSEWTYTFPNDIDSFYIRFDNNGSKDGKDATLYVTDVKLEIGTKSTDWTPAPEDINADIDKAKQDVITYTNEKITTVNTNLSKATSEINILQNSIKSKVEKTDIERAIETIEIGGRNLLRNSNFKYDKNYWTFETGGDVRIISDNLFSTILKTQCTRFNGTVQTTDIKKGDLITVSFFAKGESNINFYGAWITDGSTNYPINNRETFAITDTWKQYKVTYESKNDGGKNQKLYFYLDLDKCVYLTNIKVEKGNKATDWTPAPDDVNQQIADSIKTTEEKIKTAKSEVIQVTDSIKQSVVSLDSKTKTIESTMNGKVSKEEFKTVTDKTASLETNLNGISGKVSSVEENFKNLEIGGRNLLSNTYKFDNLNNWGFSKGPNQSGILELVNDPVYGNVLHTSKPNSVSWWVLGNYPIRLPNGKFSIGKEYTISFYAKAKSQVSVFIAFMDGNGKDSISKTSIQFDLTTEWKYYSGTIKAISTGNLPQLYICSNIGEHWWTMFKLEEGNKATGWSIAQEDIEKSITDKMAEVKITTDGINSKVSNIETKTNNHESRIATAEQKITPNSIINTLRSSDVYKNDLGSKASMSQFTQLQQNLDNFKFEIKQTGTNNLLKNSTGLNSSKYWGAYQHVTLEGVKDTDAIGRTQKGYVLKLGNQESGFGCAASMYEPLKANTTYTLSGKYWAGYGTKGASILVVCSYNVNRIGEYGYYYDQTFRAFTDGQESNTYKPFSFTFTTNSNVKCGCIRIDNLGSKDGNNRYCYFADLMLNEGKLAIPWTTHSDEINGSVVKIDSEEIRADYSDGTYVSIGKDGFCWHKSGEKFPYHALIEYYMANISGPKFKSAGDGWYRWRVQLPDCFKGKKFTPFCQIQGYWSTDGGYSVLTCGIDWEKGGVNYYDAYFDVLVCSVSRNNDLTTDYNINVFAWAIA